MSKYMVILVVGVLSVACIAQEAQEQGQEENPISVALSTGYSTAYATNFGLLCGKDSWVSELALEHESGLYAGVFYNHGFREFGEEGADWSKEVDFTLGWSTEIAGLTFDFSGTYWECWELGKYDNDFWYPALEVSKEIELSDSQTLTPSVQAAFPFSVAEDGDDGALLFLKLTHGWQVNEKVSVETWGSLVKDDGVIGLQPGWVGEPGVVASYQLTDNFSINAGVRGILLLSGGMEEKNVREPMVIFSTNLVLEF